MVLPLVSFESLHGILGKLYEDMMPLCGDMTSVASAIAGLGAMLYICYRVWKALASAEPIDLFPLLRPFAAESRTQSRNGLSGLGRRVRPPNRGTRPLA